MMMMIRYFVNWAPGYATVAAAAELSQTPARSPLPCTQDVGVAKLVAAERIRQFSRHSSSAIHNLSVQHSNSCGEVTPQSLQSRYDRHFVGITRHNALS